MVDLGLHLVWQVTADLTSSFWKCSVKTCRQLDLSICAALSLNPSHRVDVREGKPDSSKYFLLFLSMAVFIVINNRHIF